MSEWSGTFTKYTRAIGWRTAAHLGNSATKIIAMSGDSRPDGSGRAAQNSREARDAKVCLNCTKPKCEGSYDCYLRERKRQEKAKEEES